MNHPKPRALKVLQGTDQPSRRNPAEAKPEIGAKMPSGLSRGAQAFWKRHAPMLTRLGLLTEADGPAFAMLAETWASWRANLRERDYHAQAAAGRDRQAMIGLLDRFGMTPSARTRVAIAKGEDEKDPVAQWMAR